MWIPLLTPTLEPVTMISVPFQFIWIVMDQIRMVQSMALMSPIHVTVNQKLVQVDLVVLVVAVEVWWTNWGCVFLVVKVVAMEKT